MGGRREILAFCAILAVCVSAFFHETLFVGKVLSPADVLLVSASFRGEAAAAYEPANRLLMDPVLQFQPWLEFNRRMIRSGRLPLWNGHAGCGAPHLANGQSAVFDPFHLLAYLGSDVRLPMPGSPRAGCGWPGWGCFCWLARGDSASGAAGSPGWFIRSAASWSCGCFPGHRRGDLDALALPGDRPAVSGSRRPGRPGWLAVVVALVVLGGHIQTSAHVLLAGGLYALAQGWLATGAARPERGGPCFAGRWGRAWAWLLSSSADPAAGVLPGEEPGLERAPARDGRPGG